MDWNARCGVPVPMDLDIEDLSMNAKRIVFGALVVITAAAMTGCGWSVNVKKTMGKPVEIDAGISGQFPAAIRAMTMRGAAVTADTLYIDTSGTDFALSASGNVAITLTDSSGNVIASSTFPWIKSGTRLIFSDPTSVQNWLNQYPSAANASSQLVVGSTPVDGQDHVISSAIVYQGSTQASQVATVPAECYGKYNKVMPCAQ